MRVAPLPRPNLMAAVNPRRAYTLLELLLVMAIIVMISAIAYPAMDSYFSYVKVTAAADSVRGAWSQARARSIQDGIPYRFSVAPGSTHYRVAPDQLAYW